MSQTAFPSDHRDRRRAILGTAARLICEKGYEGASIQDIATACRLTKAGLYHHIRSKEHLLLEIMNYGMDVFEEQVVTPGAAHPDPLERLKACMEQEHPAGDAGRSKEITIILHEHNTLTGEARAQINARKKRYVRLLETLVRRGHAGGPDPPREPQGGGLLVPGHGAVDLQVVPPGRRVSSTSWRARCSSCSSAAWNASRSRVP